MTRDLRRLALATAIACLGGTHMLFAHDAVTAIVLLSSGDPRLGVPCAIKVSVLAPPGVPIVRQIRRVSISGAMTGHAMPPLEIELARGEFRDEYVGHIAFSMAGPWRITLRIDVPSEQMWGILDVAVRGESETVDARPLRYVLEMQDPVRQTVFPPLATAETAIALTLLFELAAVGYAWRRGRFGARATAWSQLESPVARAASSDTQRLEVSAPR